MTDAEIIEQIEQVARRHVGFSGRLEPDMRLVEDLELDSIKMLTLAIEVENKFEVSLDPEQDHALVTVNDLVAAIRSRRGS